MSAARLSLVVTTSGTRLPEVERLARSVAASPAADRVELVVVDQSADRAAARAVEAVAAEQPSLRLAVTTSGRGASAGRNAGLAVAGGDVVGFPNDNTWYPAAALPAVLDRFAGDPGLDGLAVLVTTADGRPAMLRWPVVSGPVRRTTVHRIGITPGLFFRRGLVEVLGGLDERIGTGSASAAQSGEDSDLVLRALARGARVEFDREVLVHNDEPRDALDERFVTKMAGYGIGQGVLWRRHRLPLHLLAALVGRKLVAAPVRAARGQALLARADLAWARGCVTGLLLAGPAGDTPVGPLHAGSPGSRS